MSREYLLLFFPLSLGPSKDFKCHALNFLQRNVANCVKQTDRTNNGKVKGNAKMEGSKLKQAHDSVK